jgi:hypothetical protein
MTRGPVGDQWEGEIRTRGVTDPRPRGGTARIGDLSSDGL